MRAIDRDSSASTSFRISFETSEGESPLPSWGYFHLMLGSFVANSESTSSRLIVGIVVPSRSFAAAFCATGVVVARSLRHADRIVGEKYLELLCELPLGTRIGYAEGDETVPAVVEGCAQEGSSRYFCLRVRRGKNETISKLPVTALSQVRDVVKSVATGRDNQVELDGLGRFLSGWCQHQLAGRQVREFLLASGVHCVFLGNLTRLREEIERTRFSVEGPDGLASTGTLQDVLAVSGFKGLHRSARVHALAASGGHATASTPDSVIVFDGAIGYLKSRNLWHDSNWIVILDRSEAQFDLAVDQLNRDFVQRRVSDATFKGLPPTPPGVELIVYEVGRR